MVDKSKHPETNQPAYETMPIPKQAADDRVL